MPETAFVRTPALARISDYPKHYAETCPGSEAIVASARSLGYAAFDRAIDAVARAMLALGIGKGDRVAMLAVPRPEYLIHFMATARIGAIWLGLNPRYQLDELDYVLGDASPRLVCAMLQIEGRDYREEFTTLAATRLENATLVALDGSPAHIGAEAFLDWTGFIDAGQSVEDDKLSEAAADIQIEDPALVVYTSGTTGQPKGALLSHRAIVTTARIQCEHWWAEPFRILNNLPINHIGGAVQMACQAIVAGGANVLMERFDPVAMPGVVKRTGITVMHQVPTMYHLLLEKGRPTPDQFASLQTLVWSGGPAPLPLIRELHRFAPQLYTSYGLTEAGGEVLYTPEGASDEILSETVGWPDPRIDVRLGSEDGQGATIADIGEIQVRGPTVVSGYFQRPDATRQAWTPDGWLRTGDLGQRRPDGLFRIVGRLKEMFKSGGYNVYPREVELVLERHPGVAMAAVVGVPDAVYGEVGHAWVLASAQPATAAELEAFCREHLANYKVPKHIHISDELPMLPVGKINKVALRQTAKGAA